MVCRLGRLAWATPARLAAPTGQRVAILLPLSGPRAEIGQSMLHAAQLAFDGPGAGSLDARDTGGTPEGAAAAARSAIDAGRGIDPRAAHLG